MKKRIFLSAILSLTVVFWSGCSFIHKHTADEEWSSNEFAHWKNVTCNLGMCKIDVETYDHVDEDKDFYCDVCGYEMPEHEHTGEMHFSEWAHWYSYTCGCPSPDIAEEHHDYDGDGFCDVCSYEIGKPAPTNYFLRNQAGCEWLQETTAEDIAQIKIIDETVGVAPGNLKNIQSSTDEAVIARIFEEYYWLDTWPIPKEEGEICGGGAVTVEFMLKDGTKKTLYINNGNYYDTNGNYFDLLYTPQFNESDSVRKACGFITYIGTGAVYDGEMLVCEIPMDELEFDYGMDLDLPDLPPYNMVIKTEFGDLEFIAPSIFFMETGEACVLVGKNLDELIAEYTEGTAE